MKITFKQWIELKNHILEIIKIADELGLDENKEKLMEIINNIEKRNNS